MRAINFAADRDKFLQERGALVMPARHTWSNDLATNALVLERAQGERGKVEQRDLRRHESDHILDNHRLHGLTRGQVVIKTLYAGICGSDVKNAFADTCAYSYMPGRTLLHEVSGVVVAVGDGVEGLEVGDLVVANPLLLHDNYEDVLSGELRDDRTKPFSSIQTHGFGRDVFIHPASHIHRVDHTKIGPRLATLTEPFACAHGALQGQGGLAERLRERRRLYPTATYGHYNFSVVIIGGGGLGTITAVMAKHLGADTVIVLDNNPEKVARVRALGEGFYGINTDWIKKGGAAFDRARLNEMHRHIIARSRTPLLNTKGADMLINCVNHPGAAILHHPVLSGSLKPIIVQAGGSHGHIEWNERTNRALMTTEVSYTHAYRYTQNDFRAALGCISARPEHVGQLIGSITPSSENSFSGAHRALHEANTERGASGKRLVCYFNETFADDVFDTRKQ